jgi:hypothetical protein
VDPRDSVKNLALTIAVLFPIYRLSCVGLGCVGLRF